MTGFFKAVWAKITRTASWVTEKLVAAPEYCAHASSVFLAEIGSRMTRGSRWCLESFDKSARWLERGILRAMYATFRFGFRVLDAVRRAAVIAVCILHNVVTTIGLVFQTPFLLLNDRVILRMAWKQQFREFFFLDGVRGRCTAVYPTMDPYREGVATRKAEANEKAQAKRHRKNSKKTTVPSVLVDGVPVESVVTASHTTDNRPPEQQPKGRPTPKQMPQRRSTSREFGTVPSPA
jgi:hypothetical protein